MSNMLRNVRRLLDYYKIEYKFIEGSECANIDIDSLELSVYKLYDDYEILFTDGRLYNFMTEYAICGFIRRMIIND